MEDNGFHILPHEGTAATVTSSVHFGMAHSGSKYFNYCTVMENTFTLYIQDQPGMEGEGEVREGGSVLT